MALNERGVIRHVARKQQINDFSGIKYGNITPTDIDGVIEYKNKAFIFLEVKYLDADLPFGQRLALKRLVDATGNKRASIAIIAEHDIDDVTQSVPVAECSAREYYMRGLKEWKHPRKPMTVKELIDAFIKLYVKE